MATLEQLVEMSADQLEKMTDAELMEIFKPFLNVTRPELAKVNHKPKDQYKGLPIVMSDGKKKALAMLAAEGVDLTFLSRMRRKK